MLSIASKSNLIRLAAIITAVCPVFIFFDSNTVSEAAPFQTYPATKTSDGLRSVAVENDEGRVTVKIPDDIRTGDKISGTLVTEPKGATKEEQDANLAALRKRRLRLMLAKASGSTAPNDAIALSVPLSGGDTSTVKTTPKQGNTMRIEFTVGGQPGLTVDDSAIKALVPIDIIPTSAPKLPSTDSPPVKKPGDVSFDEISYRRVPLTRDDKPFVVPTLAQTGRPMRITGLFDGDSSNTIAKLGENPADIIAESPRTSILESPATVGPVMLSINENGRRVSSTIRNVSVNLSAPKTSLMKGERTVMTVRVEGLNGISESVPLTLRSSGVITMEGGPFQRLTIAPSQISSSGSFTMTRGITGIAAGGWGATATVIVRPFDVNLLDNLNVIYTGRVEVNTFTGLYLFTDHNGETVASGKGKVDAKGCDFKLEDNSGGRKVRITIDECLRTGSAKVEGQLPLGIFVVNDTNIDDNILLYSNVPKVISDKTKPPSNASV